MKKILAISLALIALAAPAFADDDAAYSVNTIGVIKYTVPPGGQMICVSMPLNPPPDATDNIWGKTSLATQLQPGSMVYFWDDVGQGWTGYSKLGSGRWSAAASNRVMVPGEAIFLKSPATATVDHVVSYIGELSTDETSDLSLTAASTLNARGYSMYPVAPASGVFGDTYIATNVTAGSAVYFWDTEGQGWSGYSRLGSGRWNAAASNHPVQVGDGIFIKDSGSSRIIEEPRPF